MKQWEHTSIWRPEGVFDEVEFPDADPLNCFASARTSTLTGFRNPAFDSSSTASVWVAEKRPVLRSLGKREMIEFSCFSNPMPNSLSASSNIRICKWDGFFWVANWDVVFHISLPNPEHTWTKEGWGKGVNSKPIVLFIDSQLTAVRTCRKSETNFSF